MKRFSHLCYYLAELFLNWEVLETKVVGKMKNRDFMFNNLFLRKSYRLWDNVEKYGGAREATDDDRIRRMRFACWISKATRNV